MNCHFTPNFYDRNILMKKQDWLLKTLNIRKEESKPVLLLMVFSFFIGLSLTFYFTASNAIFLKHFPPKMIPVSFIASGVIVYVAWWVFSRIDKNFMAQFDHSNSKLLHPSFYSTGADGDPLLSNKRDFHAF